MIGKSELLGGGEGQGAGHRELDVFEVKNSRLVVGLKCSDWTSSRLIIRTFTVLSH
jgi:hypothetical protein